MQTGPAERLGKIDVPPLGIRVAPAAPRGGIGQVFTLLLLFVFVIHFI
jgi:hypothetical protein